MDGLGPVTSEEPDSFSLVAPDLMPIGEDPDLIVDAWQKDLLNKYVELSELESAKIATTMSHIMQECVYGSFGMSVEDTDRALSLAPGKMKLKQHLSRFFAAIRKYREIVLFNVANILVEIKSVEE